MIVSVIMPAFNASPFIGQAIGSCLTAKGIHEIVIVDDGSTDETLSVIESFVSPKIKILHHPDRKNRGRSASRNLGLRHASCEWIIFCDADDVISEDRVSHLLDLDHTGIDGYYDKIGAIAEPGFDVNEMDFPELIPAEIRSDQLLDYLMSHREQTIPLQGLTIRKQAIKHHLLFDDQLEIGEDTDWIWRLLKDGAKFKAGKAAEEVALRRVHTENSYQNKALIDRGRFVFYKKWHELIQQMNVSDQSRNRIESSLRYYQRQQLKRTVKSLFVK